MKKEKEKRGTCGYHAYPASRFPILDPQNPWVDEFYGLQKRHILKLQSLERSRRVEESQIGWEGLKRLH